MPFFFKVMHPGYEPACTSSLYATNNDATNYLTSRRGNIRIGNKLKRYHRLSHIPIPQLTLHPDDTMTHSKVPGRVISDFLCFKSK